MKAWGVVGEASEPPAFPLLTAGSRRAGGRQTGGLREESPRVLGVATSTSLSPESVPWVLTGEALPHFNHKSLRFRRWAAWRWPGLWGRHFLPGLSPLRKKQPPWPSASVPGAGAGAGPGDGRLPGRAVGASSGHLWRAWPELRPILPCLCHLPRGSCSSHHRQHRHWHIVANAGQSDWT